MGGFLFVEKGEVEEGKEEEEALNDNVKLQFMQGDGYGNQVAMNMRFQVVPGKEEKGKTHGKREDSLPNTVPNREVKTKQ